MILSPPIHFRLREIQLFFLNFAKTNDDACPFVLRDFRGTAKFAIPFFEITLVTELLFCSAHGTERLVPTDSERSAQLRFDCRTTDSEEKQSCLILILFIT